MKLLSGPLNGFFRQGVFPDFGNTNFSEEYTTSSHVLGLNFWKMVFSGQERPNTIIWTSQFSENRHFFFSDNHGHNTLPILTFMRKSYEPQENETCFSNVR